MIGFGETVTLDKDREFVCFSNLQYNGKDYVLLMSNGKPLEVRFAQQSDTDAGTQLTFVEDAAERQALFELFQQQKAGGNAGE